MYKATLATDSDLLVNIRLAALKLPKVIKPAVRGTLLSPVRAQVKRQLMKEPGPVVYPIEWTSEKQRRAFFATDGFGHGIPYQRTHDLAAAWEVIFDASDAGFGTITVENPAEASDFVYGHRQQQFHINTGWPNAANELQVISLDANDRLEDLWHVLAGSAARGEL